MQTYLLTWNPKANLAEGLTWLTTGIALLSNGRRAEEQWSTGIVRRIKKGDRVFLLRQGSVLPGLIGSGFVTRGWFQDSHWVPEKQAKGINANYIELEWDRLLLPDLVIPRGKLLRGILPATLVNSQSSGRFIKPHIASRLEAHWTAHLKSSGDTSGLSVPRKSTSAPDDSFEDLNDTEDTSSFGSDNGPRVPKIYSGVKRNRRVRMKVLARGKRKCERANCGESRDYRGFIDVHHILGAAKSDRVWNCVALCPNCHREAHYAPNRKKINRELLRFASQFKK